MAGRKKIRRIVLRINPDCEEHVKLEKKIKEMCNLMGFTNIQAVIMLLKGFSFDGMYEKKEVTAKVAESVIKKDTASLAESDTKNGTASLAESDTKNNDITDKNKKTVEKLDNYLKTGHEKAMKQAESLLGTLDDFADM